MGQRGPDVITEFFFYWINNKRIGGLAFENLTNTLKDMRDADIHKAGHRAGGSLCALSPAEFIDWRDQTLWLKDAPEESGQTWWDDLWDQHLPAKP